MISSTGLFQMNGVGSSFRCEVQVPASSLGVLEPRPDRCCLVGREIVEDDGDVQVSWNVEVDQLEEGQHVGGLVGTPRVIENLSRADVHRSEQIGGPVALAVVGHGSRSGGLR
jgi:hypothetical protein